MHPIDPIISFWGECWIFWVLNLFSQHVPSSTSLCPICCAQHCPVRTYISEQYIRTHMFQISFWRANQKVIKKVSLQNKNLNLERIRPLALINMDHNYVPKSLTQPLAQAKMVTNSFGNRNFMQPMGRLSMHSWCALVFFFLGGLGELSFAFSSLFPMCSQHVFIVFPWGSPSSQVVT
jgi:hypothetical protein